MTVKEARKALRGYNRAKLHRMAPEVIGNGPVEELRGIVARKLVAGELRSFPCRECGNEYMTLDLAAICDHDEYR